MQGTKTVEQWLNALRDSGSASYRSLARQYGGEGSLARRASRVCIQALEAFARRFSAKARVLVVRTTGRVNLLGMHIDHRGGSVNPIAIKELFLVAEPRGDDTIVASNVESSKFPEESFRIRECLPRTKIQNWDAWCHDEFEKRRAETTITWSNYIRAPVLYLQHLHTDQGGNFEPPLRGMNVMVSATIPRAAGLSSSSALVVASAEACIIINDLPISGMDFIDVCGYGEWYVGTRGGSGDHSAIKFGKPGCILHITSFPVTVETITLPRGYLIVLANSFLEAKKRVGARDTFNNRVASYIFGFMLIKKSFPQHAERLRYLRDVTPSRLGVSEAEIYRILKSLPETAHREDILRLLPEHTKEILHTFRSHTEPPEGYRIRQVCLYGITECIRSDMAPPLLRAGDIESFGELINLSHDGDRVTKLVNGKRVKLENSYPDSKLDTLIGELNSGDPKRIERARLWRQPGGYNVSTPELDTLVDVARSVGGCLGAGLVGAGLGGSIVAIVREEQTQCLIDRLAREYYEPRGLPVAVEVLHPVGGSCILE